MIAQARVPIEGTYRQIWPGSRFAEPFDEQRRALLTVWLRPRRGGELDADRAREMGSIAPSQRAYADRKTLGERTTFDSGDLAALRTYCAEFGVEVRQPHWRSAVVAGAMKDLVLAFGATAATFVDASGRRFRHRMDALRVPPELAAIVRGAFGFHQWPRSRKLRTLQRHTTPLRASDVVNRYSFPDASGAGQTIAVIQLRGKFTQDDFTQCMREQGITPPQVVVKRVDDTEVEHELATTKDLEAALDVQIIGALAPGARIVIYEAPDDERGFLDAVRTAIFDTEHPPTVLSISYGWPETLWTPVVLDLLDDLFVFAALCGISVFCSSGDSGAELSYDGSPHVIAPASSAFVHACGATVIADDESKTEGAWERSGGGFSEHFGTPEWQSSAQAIAAQRHLHGGRGVPDVCAQQYPGYLTYLEGVELAMGGTSAIAPVWSALTARINERLNVPAGFFAPILYRNGSALHEITAGANDYFEAGAGWNPCTGLGAPNGTSVEAALRGESA